MVSERKIRSEYLSHCLITKDDLLYPSGFRDDELDVNIFRSCGFVTQVSHPEPKNNACDMKRKMLVTLAENGNKIAQYDLGIFYYRGMFGFHADRELGYTWLTRSAMQNYMFAQYMLGNICMSRNQEAEASAWYDKAKAAGHRGEDGEEWPRYTSVTSNSNLTCLEIQSVNPKDIGTSINPREIEKYAAYVMHMVNYRESSRRFLLGWCHTLWPQTKQILLDDFGIDWYSPEELEPGTIFD